MLYSITVFLIKWSLLLFYWQLTVWNPLRIATGAMFVIVLVNSLLMIFIWTFFCRPVNYWSGDSYWGGVSCSLNLYTRSQIILPSINIATDVIIWIIPLPMVWKIRQGYRERFLTFVTFGVGALACIACGIRYVFIITACTSYHKLVLISIYEQTQYTHITESK